MRRAIRGCLEGIDDGFLQPLDVSSKIFDSLSVLIRGLSKLQHRARDLDGPRHTSVRSHLKLVDHCDECTDDSLQAYRRDSSCSLICDLQNGLEDIPGFGFLGGSSPHSESSNPRLYTENRNAAIVITLLSTEAIALVCGKRGCGGSDP